MNMNPLFLSASNTVAETIVLDTLQDKLLYGLQTTLLGMGVVFAVLIILWAVLSVFKLVFYKPTKKDAPAKAEAPIAPMAVVAPEPTPAPTEADDAELVAAITAAIAMTLDAPATSFRVVSFKRTAKK